MSSFLCVDVIVTSSAYEDVCMCDGGFEISCMYRLKSVGESTEPCGTPLVMLSAFDDFPS